MSWLTRGKKIAAFKKRTKCLDASLKINQVRKKKLFISITISIGNRTEWSPIRSVIIRVMNKIGLINYSVIYMGYRNLRFFMNFCLRGTKTWRGYARWLWDSERHGELRLFPSWPTHVHLWRSGLSPLDSSSSAISQGTSNPTNGRL